MVLLFLVFQEEILPPRVLLTATHLDALLIHIVTVLLLQKDSVRFVNDQEGLGSGGERGERVATQA